ncbi:MAG TPA: DUF4265 domain-containing protein [Trinickia sp.]|uniref:DUF4265 domain-containing protein n=1 Tax=Trinickia sp. TaxID=2571163 RepID=UPI002BC5294A|nr:DUF4265 domain-containing protein [Trinickia sp.]HVW50488.1 DUF4265 domain-containing protein [Trinickia sp.]
MQGFAKIVFHLKIDADGYPPVAFESLWGVPMGENSYVIDNVPYYVCGVSKGDTIATDEIDGELTASGVIARGGHSTLRVFAEGEETRKAMVQSLKQLGAQCSVTEGLSLFAVDIAADIDFQRIDAFLASQSDGEHVAYEDACLQHAGIDGIRRNECASLATIPLRLN